MATPQIKSNGRQFRHSGRKRCHKSTRFVGGTIGSETVYSSGDARGANRWGPGGIPVGRYADALESDPCNRKATRDRDRGMLRAAERREARIQESPVKATIVHESDAGRLEVGYRD